MACVDEQPIERRPADDRPAVRRHGTKPAPGLDVTGSVHAEQLRRSAAQDIDASGIECRVAFEIGDAGNRYRRPPTARERGEYRRKASASVNMPASCCGRCSTAASSLAASRRNEHIRIALPFAMATARLPHWWQAWSQDRRLSCSVVVGNIHDLVTSLVSDNVDLMICYHHAQQPIHLDPDRYERVILGTEFLRPYASEALVAKGGASLPGRASHPVPLLMYSPGVYFARLVDLILENAPIFGVRVIESDMSDVVCGMALGGRGIAWLTEGTVAAYGRKRLTPIGGDKWALPLSLVAFRGRMHDGQRALNLFWSELCRHSAGHAGGGLARIGSRLPAKRPGKLLS
jgi:DNA-binding transcriptional LysR family regulator